MDKTEFATYIEKQRKENHKDILTDICMAINNCADCHNDETHKAECNPFGCLEVFNVSANGFYTNTYDSKTNRKLFEIASQYGYQVGFVMDEKSVVTGIKFYK